MASPPTAPSCLPRFVARLSAAALLWAGGCSSPNRSPESDVIEVERIDLTAPADAPPEDAIVLPDAPPAPAAAPPAETVPAAEAK